MVINEIPFSFEIVSMVLTTQEIIQDMIPNVILGCFMGFFGIHHLFKNIKREVSSDFVRVERN